MKSNLSKKREISMQPKKEDYRKTEKKPVSEQISFRVGYDIVHKLDVFASRKKIKKVNAVKDALNYWFSIDGKVTDIEKIISDSKKELECKRRLLVEKDARIKELSDIISVYKKE